MCLLFCVFIILCVYCFVCLLFCVFIILCVYYFVCLLFCVFIILCVYCLCDYYFVCLIFCVFNILCVYCFVCLLFCVFIILCLLFCMFVIFVFIIPWLGIIAYLSIVWCELWRRGLFRSILFHLRTGVFYLIRVKRKTEKCCRKVNKWTYSFQVSCLWRFKSLLSRGVTLTPHPLLLTRSKIEYSYTSNLPKGFRGLWQDETYLNLYWLRIRLFLETYFGPECWNPQK